MVAMKYPEARAKPPSGRRQAWGQAKVNAEGKREVGNRIAVVEADQPSSSASCGVGRAVGLKVLPLKNSDVFGESMRLRNWQFVFA